MTALPMVLELAPEPAVDRAARGARMLDTRGRGWAKRVTGEIDIGSCAACVLGQVYGRFTRGLDRLAPPTSAHSRTGWAFDHGFVYDGPADREALNAAWRAEIARRVGAP